MRFSRFFIERPIFATVLSLLLLVAGGVALFVLPIDQYPSITPPTVQVTAVYPGANAETIAQTVGIPIEQQVNGVDGMLYMSSTSSSSGTYQLTVTFEVGTDIDMATVLVQNRVNIAMNSLPSEVVQQGVTVQKQSTNIVLFITLTGDKEHDQLYLSNYAELQIVDQLTRTPGVGGVSIMGAGNYSMRVWLDPEAMRIRGISPAEVYQAISKQNLAVSAGCPGLLLPIVLLIILLPVFIALLPGLWRRPLINGLRLRLRSRCGCLRAALLRGSAFGAESLSVFK